MRYFFCICIVFIISDPCMALENNDIENIIQNSAGTAYRDIGVTVKGETLTVTYWPIGYRNEFTAYCELKKIITTNEFINNFKALELIQVSWGVPVLKSVIELGKKDTTDTFKTVFRHDNFPAKKKSNHNSRKFLLQFDFPLSMNFGSFEDTFIFKTGIRSDLRYLVYPGMIAYGQIDLYAYNEYQPSNWYKPANLGFAVVKPVWENVVSMTNIGLFAYNDLYGFDEEIVYYFLNDRYSFKLHVGTYGDLWFYDNRFVYKKINKNLIIGKLTSYHSVYDCSLKFEFGRFLNGDEGSGIGISRIFHEVEIGLSGRYSGGEFNGFIDFSVPLFPPKRKSMVSRGIAPVKRLEYTYRYNSKTMNYDPTIKPKAVEPVVGINFREIQGFTRPEHFIYSSRFNKYTMH